MVKATDVPPLTKVITVNDGLPQSYVSGIAQDEQGFLWVSTLNGLARYDGRGFKAYRHTSADTAGLGSNIILHLFYAGSNNLWLCYPDGKIDQFNTISEKLIHLWKNKTYYPLQQEAGNFNSFIRGDNATNWMIANDGGVYSINVGKGVIKHFSPADLATTGPVLGIATQSNTLLLLTQSGLCTYTQTGKFIKIAPYPFNINKFKTGINNVYSPAIRANGDLIISDANGVKIWNPTTGSYKYIPLNHPDHHNKITSGFDNAGNYIFAFDARIFVLQPNNLLIAQPRSADMPKWLPAVAFIDRSGVLWIGTNGFGLRQYNLLKTGLPGYPNQQSFAIDVLKRYGVPDARINKTFLSTSVPYANRAVTIKDSVWFCDVNQLATNPQLVLYANKTITQVTFNNSDGRNAQMHRTRFLAVCNKLCLWGIDEHSRPVKFDYQTRSYQQYPKTAIGTGEEINGMAADGASSFYISTNKNLYLIDALTGNTSNLTAHLPSKDLLYVCNDPADVNALWIGTLSDGIIRYNKRTAKTQIFNISTGLPNNTIYSILPGDDHLLWCSSNKGIFAFNEKNKTVRPFTSRDGLTDDEFNRFYYLKLPGGDIAFGGSMGYTIFNPAKLKTDSFEPQVTVTDLKVINKPYFDKPVAASIQLDLQYDQNFITVDFAAMQFDFPEKLQYRYRLKGLDKNWVMDGNVGKAAYTSLPPGNYTLLLNATNTAGKWSSKIRPITIIVAPPYWKTWWFCLVAVILVVFVFYLVLAIRISRVKKTEAIKLKFEREAMELHALALRTRMNPHFIFNCLNSIKALIQEKEDRKAINYLTTFSVLIRKQLNNTENEVTLYDELETCRLYLQLEAMRFDERIAYNFDTDDECPTRQIKVPPLILQPLVENAIVHGLLPAENGGTVSIKVHCDEQYCICEIRDNGIGRAAAEKNKAKSNLLHQSKGVQLIQERITMYNRLHERVSSFDTVDLFNNDHKPAGTLVIVKFKIEL